MIHLRHTPRALLLAGAALLPIAFAAPVVAAGPAPHRAIVAPAAAPAPAVHIAYRQFTLPNGLTAIVYSDRAVPSVYVGVRYRTGSKDEPVGRTGFAHLFEHLMFQSTRNRKGGFLEAMEAIGASGINGQTTSDWTDYREVVPSGALDTALWLESDRMQYLADGITQQEFEQQRGVVENEKRQGELQPGAKAGDRYLEGFYPAGHPYAHAVIGSMADLDRAALADVKQWYTDYYGASNAVLVVAGDVDFDTAREKITRYFGGVRPGRAIDRVDQWLPVFGDVKRETLYDKVGAATFTRSWPVANDDPREKTLLQLAARTMASTPDTPLVHALVDGGMAVGVNAQFDDSRLGSSFTLSVALRPGVSPEQAGAALDRALAAYLAQGPDRQRLQAVVANTDVALLRLMESAPAVAGWLIGSAVDHGDPGYFLKQRDWIAAATAPEVLRVAAKWLGRPYYELRILPEPLAQAAADVDRSQMPAATVKPADVRFPPIHETRLANGLRIVVAERHGLPIVDARLRFGTGALVDRGYAPGAARQALALLDEGNATMRATDFAERLAAIGASFSAAAGPRDATVNWSGTTATLDQSFALAAAAIRTPTYPEDAVRKAVQAIDPDYDAMVRNPMDSAGLLYAHALWGADHPNGRIVTRAEAKTLNRDAIRRFHDAELGPNNSTLYLIGDITLAQARALAERHFGTWQPVKATPLPVAPAPTASGPRVILVDAPVAPQTSITAGHFVAPYDAAQAPTERLTDAVLGSGFQSRLNADLREQKGWSYGVTAGIGDAVQGPRLFTASGSVQADKTGASMMEIRQQIRDFLKDRPITEAELARERQAAVQTIPLAYTGNAAFLGAILTADGHGLPLDYGEGTVARLTQVSLAEARALAAQTYHPDAMTWVIIGDLARIEPEVRALDFGPVEVWDAFGNRLR